MELGVVEHHAALFRQAGNVAIAVLPADVVARIDLPRIEPLRRIVVDAERRTSLEGVWAGGDCVFGGEDLTVSAVEDGKQAARSIIAQLGVARI